MSVKKKKWKTKRTSQTRRVLCRFMQNYRQQILEEPGRCDQVLQTAVPDEKLERALIGTALDAGVPQELIQRAQDLALDAVMAQAARRLHEERGLDKDFAWWTVETWALALGLLGQGDRDASPWHEKFRLQDRLGSNRAESLPQVIRTLEVQLRSLTQESEAQKEGSGNGKTAKAPLERGLHEESRRQRTLEAQEARRHEPLWGQKAFSESTVFRHSDAVTAAACSPDGVFALTGSQNGTITLWNMQNGQKIMEFPHPDWIRTMVFSPDGTRFLSASWGKTATLWHTASWKKIHEFTHGHWVHAVAFSPDGTQVLTGSGDRTAVLWDVETGQKLMVFQHDNPVMAVAFCPDGRRILTGCADASAALWDVKGRRGPNLA